MSSVGEQLRSGGVFAGYRIDGEIARGGMGVVYRASELRPERTVALKVVAPQLAADPNFRDRFLQEAQAAASIEHPHVVPVLRVDEQDGVLFIVMRYVRGQDLHSVIGVEGRLQPRRAARIVDQIADALDSAHERGLVHRDVKPANILIEHHRRGDHAYLTDFGLAKSLAAAGRLTSTGVVVGTTDYMAPEQWAGGRLDARVDVYSLGCVLYESLTGEVPYAREGHAARMYAHVNAPPPHAREIAADVSVALDAVVIRALAKAPDDRYPSAGDLGIAALAAAEGRPVDRRERSVATGEAAPTKLASTRVHDDTAPTRPQRTAAAAPPVPPSDTPAPPAGGPPPHRSRWPVAGARRRRRGDSWRSRTRRRVLSGIPDADKRGNDHDTGKTHRQHTEHDDCRGDGHANRQDPHDQHDRDRHGREHPIARGGGGWRLARHGDSVHPAGHPATNRGALRNSERRRNARRESFRDHGRRSGDWTALRRSA